MIGAKVMFHFREGWFVGDILRFDTERGRYLILQQEKGGGGSRVWIDEDLVRPLPKGSPKSAVAP
jgi:hypothetical protein